MKKNLKTILAAAAVLFASCQNEQLVSDSSSDQTTHASDNVAITESNDAQTKTSLDPEGNVLWKTGDQLTVFSKANISEHISNIYKQGELMQESTVRKFRTVRKEGNRMVSRELDFFIHTDTPPAEMVFFNGDFFTARVALEQLIKTATQRAIIIDNSLYHVVYPEHRRRGHSLNAVGTKMSAITLMGIHPDVILSEIR